jgi:DUF1365 family protein
MSSKITWSDGTTQTFAKDAAYVNVTDAGLIVATFGDKTFYVSPFAYKQLVVDQT